MTSGSGHQTSSSRWYEIVLSYYPDALCRTYTVPPVHFNRVPYTMDTVPGTSQLALSSLRESFPQIPAKRKWTPSPVHKPQKPSAPVFGPPQAIWPQEQLDNSEYNVQESDLRDDAAQAHIIRNLEELGRHRGEVMFILSQFNVQSYLNKPEYKVASSQLPHPSQLNKPGTRFSRGEFDVLIVHRHYGILLGEIKSVGHSHIDLKMTQAKSDAAVSKRVAKSLLQLARMETVIRHLVTDIIPHLTIRTALFLPYVSRAQLQRILTADPQLEHEACQVLGAADGTQVAQLCVCADDVSGRRTWWDVTPGVLSKLSKWWTGRMVTVDPAMRDQIYLDIVARFVGPASSVTVYCSTSPRVEVRTEGEAVAELGLRLARLVLTPSQFDLASRQLPLVYLTGPPGTGKTVMLVVMGLSWLNQGIDIYVVSTSINSFAVSILIMEQLKNTVAANPASPTPVGKVLHHHYDFVTDGASLARAVSELTAAALGGAHIIMDEMIFNTSEILGQRNYNLIDQLIRHVPGLHLWCAGVFYSFAPPSGLLVKILTTPLRSAPVVLREVQPVLGRLPNEIHNYGDTGIPAPGDGQRVRCLRHEGNAHIGRCPVNCLQCGKDVAEELRLLGVGVPGSNVTYRDVFILTGSSDLQDEVRNNTDSVTSPASSFVRGIREMGMPVCVLTSKESQSDKACFERKVMDVATAVTDWITVASSLAVLGLERKVVVWLPSVVDNQDNNTYDHDADRLFLVTRCTTQLIVVDVPPAASSDDTGSDDTGVSWARKGFLL